MFLFNFTKIDYSTLVGFSITTIFLLFLWFWLGAFSGIDSCGVCHPRMTIFDNWWCSERGIFRDRIIVSVQDCMFYYLCFIQNSELNLLWMIHIAGNFGVVHEGVLKTGGNVVSVAVKSIKSEPFPYVLTSNITPIWYIQVCCIHTMNYVE